LHTTGKLKKRLALSCACFWLLAAPVAYSQDLNAPKQELEVLRERIQGLERALSRNQSTRDDTLEQVKSSGQAIEATARELEALATKRGAVNSELTALQSQKNATETRVKAAQKRIAAIYYRNYVKGETPIAGRVLSGENPNETGRQLQYSSYLARSQAQVVGELRADLTELKSLRDATARKGTQLGAVAREEKEKHAQLVAQHEEQKQRVASLEARISRQRDTIEDYRRDEAKLAQLITRLTQEIATKKMRDAERKRKRAQARAQKHQREVREARAKGRPEPAPVNIEVEEPAHTAHGAFGRLQGRLPRPVAGELAHRFGSQRAEGGISWKGIFFRAAQGAPVQAVAGGEVVYADWMRGFGQLLIIDHGGGYMSLYANNEALRKAVGDGVRQGEAIASVGASGSNLETGLYFEVRFRSRVLNPLSWLRN